MFIYKLFKCVHLLICQGEKVAEGRLCASSLLCCHQTQPGSKANTMWPAFCTCVPFPLNIL